MSARTTNIAEALFLHQKGNRLSDLTSIAADPDGIDACAFTFEGEHAEADHRDYLAHRIDLDFSALPDLFEAIEAVLPGKAAL